jgi:dihydrofolate reductase
MRKVFLSNLISLDGYFEGPNREIDWFVWSEELRDYSIEMLKTVDTLLFGRVTYQRMAAYWPTATAEDPVVARSMNSLPKIVFSKTLDKADWNNTRLVKGDIGEEISRLKQLPGKDMAIFGSSDLAVSIAEQGLLDEYRFLVNPVVLGAGKPMFKGIRSKLNLKLLTTETLKSGVVILTYLPKSK